MQYYFNLTLFLYEIPHMLQHIYVNIPSVTTNMECLHNQIWDSSLCRNKISWNGSLCKEVNLFWLYKFDILIRYLI